MDRIETWPDKITGERQWLEVLPVGTRIRSVQHPELTGYVKAHEYHESGYLSPIPYLISWDDSELASKTLGWVFVYASPGAIEAIE